jgi:hypothetical protein
MQVTPKEILANHNYQFDGSHPNRNECALNAMTTLLQTAAKRNSVQLDLDAAALGRFLDRVPFRHPRFPAWFPGPGGATHPRAAWKGMERYIAHLKQQGSELHWRVGLRYIDDTDTLTTLANYLRFGSLVMLYGVGRSGVPHTVIPVERIKDGWRIDDPGYPADKNPHTWSDAELLSWWTNYGWIYPAGTLVALFPVPVP